MGIARRAGGGETAAAAQPIIAEEKAMAILGENKWDKFAELSLKEEGVTV